MSDSLEERRSLANWITIRQRDFCRGSEMFDYLIENLLKTGNSTVFIDGGSEILGLINFTINNIGKEKMIVTKGICVPSNNSSEKRGSMLLNILKQLASNLQIKKIAIFSLPEAKMFYEKNGFIEEEEDSDFMMFSIEDGKLYFKTNTGGKKLTKKMRRKRRSKKTRHYKRIKKTI
jgi:hypothetical protein